MSSGSNSPELTALLLPRAVRLAVRPGFAAAGTCMRIKHQRVAMRLCTVRQDRPVVFGAQQWWRFERPSANLRRTAGVALLALQPGLDLDDRRAGLRLLLSTRCAGDSSYARGARPLIMQAGICLVRSLGDSEPASQALRV